MSRSGPVYILSEFDWRLIVNLMADRDILLDSLRSYAEPESPNVPSQRNIDFVRNKFTS